MVQYRALFLELLHRKHHRRRKNCLFVPASRCSASASFSCSREGIPKSGCAHVPPFFFLSLTPLQLRAQSAASSSSSSTLLLSPICFCSNSLYAGESLPPVLEENAENFEIKCWYTESYKSQLPHLRHFHYHVHQFTIMVYYTNFGIKNNYIFWFFV